MGGAGESLVWAGLVSYAYVCWYFIHHHIRLQVISDFFLILCDRTFHFSPIEVNLRVKYLGVKIGENRVSHKAQNITCVYVHVWGMPGCQY